MTEFSRQIRERAAPAYQPAGSPPVHAERRAEGELHKAAGLGFSLGNMSIYPKVQAKLTVGPVNDQYEQEADRVAEQAVSMPEPAGLQRQADDEDEELQAKPLAEDITAITQRQVEEEEEKLQAKPLAEGITPLVQRQDSEDEELQMEPDNACPECESEDEELQAKPQAESITPIVQREVDLQPQAEDEDEGLQAKPLVEGITSLAQRQVDADEEEENLQTKLLVQRAGSEATEAGPELEQSINQARGGGVQLADGVRRRMEGAFGVDFGSVRVHSDANADRLNRSIQARAFTTGQDIFLRQGEYQSGSSEGQRLLAHELTHVVQQNGGALQRAQMQSTGANINGVRVHTDAQSDQLNQSTHLKAFTTGQDVFFRQGAYQPGIRGGQELIAHELNHVLQQTSMPLHHAHRQTEEPEVVRISPKTTVLQCKNNKPKRPKEVSGNEKSELEKAVRENKQPEFKRLAKIIFGKDPEYYRKLRQYKLKKHEKNHEKRNIWNSFNPTPEQGGVKVTPDELQDAMSNQAPPKPKVQKQGMDNQCGPSSIVNILHSMGQKGVTLEDLQTKVAMQILAGNSNFQKTMTLNGVLVDRANEIRKQKGTLGGGMVMSAYDARELPAVLALYGVESSAGFEGQGILVESLSKASMKPVILLHQGHFTVCLKAEPWTVYRDPANQYDQSAELEFMDSWGLTPDLVKGKIYALGGQGKVLYYRGSWITNAWVVKVT